ncbi:RNA polymerase sigma factor [Microbacterium marinilacus]|uniref:Sigma-70 family RNA polymerase sigma factor n=1 Tax=Microbacterium marinilacus TaxID=415209 RepID=A0ABP7BC46_9MICO|nr:RNA polymerase sigma factor [Microbacterium marinilacus]MBY0689416.1 RNA polymerase sigma factor [Microbacterium marinilacus]
MSLDGAMTGEIPSGAAAFTAASADSASRERDAERAFEAAVAPLVPLLLRYFTRRVTPADDAADCTSETLLALWRHRSRLPHADDERRAWAYGIARRVRANHHRGRVRRATADSALRAAAATPVPPVPDEAFVAAEALALLPERDQELIRLVIWEELSVADAGRVLGIRPGAARTRYHRALARLRRSYAALDRD